MTSIRCFFGLHATTTIVHLKDARVYLHQPGDGVWPAIIAASPVLAVTVGCHRCREGMS